MMHFIEMIPLIGFFISYKFYGIKSATATVLILTVLMFVVSLVRGQKLSTLSIVSNIILVLCATLTLMIDNTSFIKMKPTVVFLIFATLFMIKGKVLLQNIFGSILELNNKQLSMLSKLWAIFFLCSSILNEIVWRNFPENSWVTFKVIILPSFSAIFIISQLLFLKKYFKVRSS